MLTVADIEPHIEGEFGARFEPQGFQRTGRRKWVRSQKSPIRELFVIGALKGAQYSPEWGFPPVSRHPSGRANFDGSARIKAP
jgi:hypothetical protein